MNKRWQEQNANFSVTFRKETFEALKDSANRTGKGLHRLMKDFLRLNLFPFMERGDYIYIREVNVEEYKVGVTLHLNARLLVKASELERRAV